MLRYIPEGVPLVGAEVGVHRGKTSATLLARRPQLTLYMVDYWGLLDDVTPPQGRWGREIYEEALAETEFGADRRRVVLGVSPDAAREVPGGLDFVFVDAGHYYNEVLADLRAWWPKVKTGGYLFGHDIDNPDSSFADWGVREAAEEFSAEVDVPMEVFPPPEMVFVMRKP